MLKLCLLLLSAISVIGFVTSSRADALPYGAGTYGTCQYSTCSISLTSSGNVTLNLTPTSGGVYTIQPNQLTVDTGSSTGYTLTLIDSDTNTSLVDGAKTISASSGTPASPSVLSSISWGYRVDGIAGFGAGPTTAQTNVSSSSLTFAGIPASNLTAHTIASSSSAQVSPEATNVWYGVFVTSTQQSGSYSDIVTSTALIN